MGKMNRFQYYTKFFTYLIVVILINIAGITLFFRMDLTQNKIYSLSEISKRVVATLSEPLTIKVFFSENLPAPHNDTERYLRDLLEEYAIAANEFFNYRFYDVTTNESGVSPKALGNQQIANNYGIYPVQIQNIEEDEVKFKKAYMGLAMIHGDLIEKIPSITSTDGLEYKLTTAVQKLNNKISALLNLEGNIQIKLILSSSLKKIAKYIHLEELVSLPRELGKIVEKLNPAAYAKLTFEHLDPSENKSLASMVEKHNVLTLSWPDIPEADIEPGSGSVGLVMTYRDKSVTVPLVNVMRLPLVGTQYSMADMADMEDTINENMESLIDINEDMGYLAHHGTLQPSMTAIMNPMQEQQDPISNFRGLISRNYTLRNVTLKDRPLSGGYKCLVIAGPTESFTEYELFQIDQYIMRGNNLALFLDAFEEKTPPPNQPYMQSQHIPIKTGLEKLLAHYGVNIKNAYVLDKNCFKQLTRTRTGGRETPIYFAPIIKNTFINHELDFMKNIKSLILLKAAPLTPYEKRIQENKLIGHPLLSTSETSWKMSGRINLNPMMIQPPPENEMQSMPVAYWLEGEFPSYFAGKQIPEKETKKPDTAEKDTPKKEEKEPGLDVIKGKGEIITKAKPAKILLIGTSEVIQNNLIDQEGTTPNATFVLNALDALNDRTEIAVMRSKEQRFNPLRETTAGVKTFVKAFNIAGLPVLVALFGLMVWFRRHARQRHIQMMFQK